MVLVVILAFCLDIFQISKFLKYNNTKPQALPSKAEGHGGKQRSAGTIRGDNKMFLMMMVMMMVDKVVVVFKVVVMIMLVMTIVDKVVLVVKVVVVMIMLVMMTEK